MSNYCLLILLLFSFGIGGCGNKEPQNHMGESKPNIIYILADDLGYGDLSVYGQEHFDTPNIDRLAHNGMRFTQHYAGATVCAPSRSALMTGLHTGHTPIRGNRRMNDGQFPMPAGMVTLPQVLKGAGYVTGAFGKWGLGFRGSEGDPLNQGFDNFFGYISQTVAHNYYPWELHENGEIIVLEENEGTKRGRYAPHLIHQKTLKFIEANKDTAFFLYIPTIIPHAELFAPDDYMKAFLQEDAQAEHGYTSKFGPETAYHGIDEESDPRFKVGGYGSQKYPRAAFAAMVSLLDDQVGEIMAKLEELGIAENTLVVFTSDNGPHKEGGADPDFFNSNGPFQGYKRDLYEGGIRVPMIAHWPAKIEAGSISDHVSAFWDILPTFAELAETDHPTPTDGISFAPTLLGREQESHDYLYWEFHEQNGKQAVRKGKWKAIRLDVFTDSPEFLLFDLDEDPKEENDLAGHYPQVAEEMKKMMQNGRNEDPEWPFAERRE